MERATNRESLEAVLHQLERGLQLLDACRAPAHIGAHLDMSISLLSEYLEEHEQRAPNQTARGVQASK